MHNQEHDCTSIALTDQALLERLPINAMGGNPLAFSDEQLFKMLRLSRATGSKKRSEMISAELSKRILVRARNFAFGMKLVPHPFGELRDAAHEIATFIWEHVLTSQKDARHAEVAFGQLFRRRGIDFIRSLKLNQGENEVSLDGHEGVPEETDVLPAEEEHEALQDPETPEVTLARKQEFTRIDERLRAILSEAEYQTYVLLYAADWQVQEIAKLLNVSLKTVNNYKNQALAKIEKEFKQ